MKYSSITQVLNEVTPHSIRWCTPSIEPTIEKVACPYTSDMSVSFSGLGYPGEPSGIFAEAYEKAAIAYGAEKTLFSVNGSTGSNFVVLRALSKQIPNLRILALRNIHKSILDACLDYGINLQFVDAHIDPHLQIFFPPSISSILEQVQETNPHVLLVTNPTYEGLVLDLHNLIDGVRRINSELIVFVDEAWGAHLAFSEKLPDSALSCGADICVQSTHKHGGALQQSGMIHWNEKRIETRLVIESYKNLTTTSPSYLLLASIDAAREQLEKNGKENIERILQIAKQLALEIDKITDLTVVNLSDFQEKSFAIAGKDETKVLVDVSQSGYAGFTLAKFLEDEHNIIVEKSNAMTLLFLVPFQSKAEHVTATVEALQTVLHTHTECKNTLTFPLLETPTQNPRRLELKEVSHLLSCQVETIPLRHASGRISAENITPYPPGIPMTIQGEELTAQAITYYETLKDYPNSHVFAQDLTLQTVQVVKQNSFFSKFNFLR